MDRLQGLNDAHQIVVTARKAVYGENEVAWQLLVRIGFRLQEACKTEGAAYFAA